METDRNRAVSGEIDQRVEKKKILSGAGTVMGILLALLALSDTMQPGTVVWESVDGWGIHMLMMALGLGGIFLLMGERSRKKCLMLDVISVLFAIFTVFGRSYMEAGDWSYVFYDELQLCRAICVGGGTA